MRHPFDGLLGVGQLQETQEPESTGITRRSLLGKMVFGTAGVLGTAALARAQVLTTQAIGEEGGPVPTTLALGEEGGKVTKALNEDGGTVDGATAATTEPFGEEAGNVTSRMVPGLEDGGAPQPKPTEAKNEEGVSTEALGEEGGPSTKALGEEGGLTRRKAEGGGPITDALNEGGGPAPVQVVQVKPLTLDINEKDLDKVWTEMGDENAAKSLQACAELYGAKQGLTYLKDHLKIKVQIPDDKEIAALLAKLDDNEFSVREEAEAKLVKAGPSIQPAIDKALKDYKSAEMQMRLNRILAKFKENNPLLQAEHALEVLVALRTPEAKDLLQTLAKGDEKDWLAQKAKKAIDRLKQ
jgi:hypothetical protein